MKKPKFTKTRIIAVRKQGDAGVLTGSVPPDQDRLDDLRPAEIGVRPDGAFELHRVKGLDSGYRKRKRVYAGLTLDNTAKKDLIAKEL